MSETWVVVEGLTGCRDRENPDPAQRCKCHGFGIETTDAPPRVICWANEDMGVSVGIHLRADAEAIVAAHNETDVLKADNARLRALVKEAEWSDYRATDSECPWCATRKFDGDYGRLLQNHTDDCPAFTPDGEVR